jgi:hypothetical protein
LLSLIFMLRSRVGCSARPKRWLDTRVIQAATLVLLAIQTARRYVNAELQTTAQRERRRVQNGWINQICAQSNKPWSDDWPPFTWLHVTLAHNGLLIATGVRVIWPVRLAEVGYVQTFYFWGDACTSFGSWCTGVRGGPSRYTVLGSWLRQLLRWPQATAHKIAILVQALSGLKKRFYYLCL